MHNGLFFKRVRDFLHTVETGRKFIATETSSLSFSELTVTALLLT